MNAMTRIVNSVQRRLDRMFPAHFSGSTKHDHFVDFGWPEQLDFSKLYRMYDRNGLAAAAVDKTVAKTWQDEPTIWETEKPKESELEARIRKRFVALRVWQMLAEADRRSMVGDYAGVILRYRDDKSFDQPVGRVGGGLDGLAGVIPAWQSQLTVSEWDDDPQSEGYGTPRMFEFNEAALGSEARSARAFRVHPDRVLIWSDDGTVNCRSALRPGYNDLLDAEKIKGAGGEGFWKTSRGAPVIEAAAGLSPADVARNMGIEVKDVLDTINDQIESFNAGFDKGLMLGGMTAKPMHIVLPSPEHFFAAPVNSFAASFLMPVKILLGSQTGERASTEDAEEWAQTCMSRRVNRCRPLIHELVMRLVRFGMLPVKDWTVGWADLTEASASEKIERAAKMAEINAKSGGAMGGEVVFTDDEIREVVGFKPLTGVQRFDDDGDGDGE